MLMPLNSGQQTLQTTKLQKIYTDKHKMEGINMDVSLKMSDLYHSLLGVLS